MKRWKMSKFYQGSKHRVVLPHRGASRWAEDSDDTSPQFISTRLDVDDHHITSTPGSNTAKLRNRTAAVSFSATFKQQL